MPGTQCYRNDTIVTSKNDTEQLENLCKILTQLNVYGLRGKRRKRDFFRKEILSCRHMIDKHGLHKSQEKTETVLKAPKPENMS